MKICAFKRAAGVRTLILLVFIFSFLFAFHHVSASAPISQLQRISVPNSDAIQYPNSVPDSAPKTSISGDGRYIVFSTDAYNFTTDQDINGLDVTSNVFLYDVQTGTYTLISKAADGSLSNGPTDNVSISSDGRYIVYDSAATNVVAGDTNDAYDIFLYDRQSGTTRRVSVDNSGNQADASSAEPVISGDGRYVAFLSDATNLVAGDTNGSADAFVYDTQANTIERISVTSDGSEIPAGTSDVNIAANGGFAVFTTTADDVVPGDTGSINDVYVYNIQTHAVERVSISDGGTQGNANSFDPTISADGQYVAFDSSASNLVAGDTNNHSDVFVYNRQTHTIERVSTSSGGTEGNGESSNSAITTDGTQVVFVSEATNLVAGDTNNKDDVFIRNLGTDTITRVSVAADGTEGDQGSYDSHPSSNGSYVIFDSTSKTFFPEDSNKPSVYTIYYKNVQANTLQELLAPAGVQADGSSNITDISQNGRYIVYTSSGANIVERDGNSADDVFVYDRQTDTNERVSVATDGTEGNNSSMGGVITNDGRYVAFTSEANNLAAGVSVDVYLYLRDRQTGTTQHIADGVDSLISVADDGRYIAFATSIPLVPEDTNEVVDIYVYDMQTDTFERVSVGSDGAQGDADSLRPILTPDGRYVAFYSYATTLVSGDANGQVDAFVYDRQTHTIERVSVASDGTEGNSTSGDGGVQPSISDDGQYVAFDSSASNLVAGDTNNAQDIFVYDRQTHATERVSIATDGTEGNDASYGGKISSDGRYVSFSSTSTNLSADDTNENDDIFLRDRTSHTTTRFVMNAAGTDSDGYSYGAISGNGNWIAFETDATNLVSGDTNREVDIYLAHIDGSGPEISAINATPSSTTATVTWTTDVNSSSSVSYGTTTGYGSTATGTGGVTSHSVNLSGLSACTTYHYTVTSVDSNDNPTTSTDGTFKTTGCSSGGGGGGSSSGTIIKTPVAVTPPATTQTNACVATKNIMPKVTLMRGTTNSTVGMIQDFLRNHGYYAGKIDNNFGPKTEAGIRAFQLAQKLSESGIWDATTAGAADIVLECSTVQVPPVIAQYAFNYNLHVGMSHPDVRKLQQYLNAHGSIIAAAGFGSPGNESIYFGSKTKAALALFQGQHGIAPAAGYFGPLTRAYVNAH